MLFSVSCFELDKPCSVAGIVLRRSGYSAFLQGTKSFRLFIFIEPRLLKYKTIVETIVIFSISGLTLIVANCAYIIILLINSSITFTPTLASQLDPGLPAWDN
jgi:hypothetical protein